MILIYMPKFLPDSWRVLSCAYAFILTLVDISSYSGLKKDTSGKFWIVQSFAPFDLLL